MNEYFDSVIVTIVIFLLIVLFSGTPDIADAIMNKINGRSTSMSYCIIHATAGEPVSLSDCDYVLKGLK